MTTPLPDVEAIVIAHLRDHADVEPLAGDRVYAEVPKTDPTYPLVRVTRISGAPVMSRPLFLDAATVQVDVFGDTKENARDLAAIVQAALSELADTATELGAVTGVELGSLAFQPDVESAPPRPRYRLDAVIWARPLPAGS